MCLFILNSRQNILKIITFLSFIYFSVEIQPNVGFTYNLEYLEPPVTQAVRGETVQTKWIEQWLNNFDSNDTRTWQMRYMENSFFLKDGGAIFIFVGGEVEIVEGWLLGGYMRDMAIELRGVMFYVEHRFYGQSRPTADISTENLQFLKIDQVLADLAQFIVHIKKTNLLLINSRVILVGASYAGALATWFMQKYPNLADGAWASSAPINAQVDFFEYKEVVSDAIEIAGGITCSHRIKKAFEQLEQLVVAKESRRVEQLFNLCYQLNLTNQLDVWNFFSGIQNEFSNIVQTHRETNHNIQVMCDGLVNNGIDNDIDALSRWWSSKNTNCFNNVYSHYVNFYNQSSWKDNNFWFGVRQWTYQTCSEFGWFQSTNSKNTLFGSSVDLKLFFQLCYDFFGPNYSPVNIQRNVDKTNNFYRGRNPKVRNVYSTHGQFDPWHKMGVEGDINLYSPTVILPHESHCSDLNSIRSDDSPEMMASKQRVFGLIRQWILHSKTLL